MAVVTDWAVLISDSLVSVPFMTGDLPGSDEPTDDDSFSGGMEKRPVNPKDALGALVTNGTLMALMHAISEGTAGSGFKVKPNGAEIDGTNRKTWSAEAMAQRAIVDKFLAIGFRGNDKPCLPVRDGIKLVARDRFAFGWGGCLVYRSKVADPTTGIAPPVALGQFQAGRAEFSKPDRHATMVPKPFALSDGTIMWAEVPHHFRRVRFGSANGSSVWLKQYGDWRTLDAKTGKYVKGNRYKPPEIGQDIGMYKPGKLPRDGIAALEMYHFSTYFPGAEPYGVSGWHSEMATIKTAAEHTQLLLTYLKSGLHSVILAASDRPFDDISAESAVSKIDELGRGRKGLGALITLALKPGDSKSTAPFNDNGTSERGRLILHEINTRLPSELLDDTLSDSLSLKLAHAERTPGLLLGRSDNYNFATASAAWMTANRLRFSPDQREHDLFLNMLLVEMGVTLWRIETLSPEWEDKPSLNNVAAVAGQYGGMSVNASLRLLGEVMDIDTEPRADWWAILPMPIVKAVLADADPYTKLITVMGDDAPPKSEFDIQRVVDGMGQIAEKINDRANAAEQQLSSKVETNPQEG
jgi:hypothetical protein